MCCKQFKIWAFTVIAIIFLVIVGILFEVRPECAYTPATNVCYAPFECLESGICDCTTEDFTEQYNQGIIAHERPYRCDPDDKERPPTIISHVVAFIVMVAGCLWIGWVGVVEYGRKCDCMDECHPDCGCPPHQPWNCKCLHTCRKCNNKSVYGVKQICACPTCLRHFKEGTSLVNKASKDKSSISDLCFCNGCHNGCKCTEHGEICSFPNKAVVIRGKGTKGH